MSATTAEVRLYAELNRFVRRPDQGGRYRVAITHRRSVKDVVESLGVPHTEVDLLLIDGRSVGFDAVVPAGSRVAAYPVFETFDVGPLQRVRPDPLRRTRFVLDVHLGTLARNLRLLGFDTRWAGDTGTNGEPGELDDAALVQVSSDERRVLLTRDRGLLMRAKVTHGACLHSEDPFEQTVEVVRRYDLAGSIAPFTRCLTCNGRLVRVDKHAVLHRLPRRTRREHDRFVRCTSCGQVYWPGSHHGRLREVVERVREAAVR